MNKPPVFTLVPESVDVTEGDSIELDCRATGKPVPQIVWYNNKEILNEDDHVMFETVDDGIECGSKILLKGIVPAIHDGKYTIEAANSVGKVTHNVMISGINTLAY